MNFIYTIATINLNSFNTLVKKNLLKEFIRDHDLDIVLLQEVSFEDFSFVSTHNALVNISSDKKGTAVLVRKAFKFSEFIFDPSGRILSVIVNQINFVNVYAHSGNNMKKERDKLFTEDMSIHVNKPGATCTVFGGDWNCILESCDSKGTHKNFSSGLRNMIECFSLKDVVFNRKENRFTFHRNEQASRLDRFYAPKEFMENVTSTSTLANAFSDHCAVTMKVKTSGEQLSLHGRGYWKINPSVLMLPDVQARFDSEYTALKQRNAYVQDINTWWNYIFKSKAKSFYKTESWRLNQTNGAAKAQLMNQLLEMSERQAKGEELTSEMSIVKTKLLDIEQQRLKNLAAKRPVGSVAEEEKLTIYQFSNRLHRNNTFNLQLKKGDEIVSECGELGNYIHDQYNEQFKARETDIGLNEEENPLNALQKTLTALESDSLLRPITEDEISSTLKSCNRKKSPGPDGLTYEFYLTHFETLKGDLMVLFNNYLSGNSLPPKEFTDGIIILVKKKGDGTALSNYRPISMLNTDYKLFTKIVANRIQEHLLSLIGPGQSACMSGRSCTNNLEDIRRLMTKSVESKRCKGLLLSLDLEKAFDSVDHNFLWKVLRKFNFPEQIVTCIQRLYGKACSKVLYNGFLTPEIKIRRSVRQGCPLSMVLFVLYIEPLIRKIDENILGVLVFDKFLRVVAYADDINVFIRNWEEFDVVLNIMFTFEKFAKIRLNLEKSCFLRINACAGGPFQITETDNLKILGVTFKATWNKTIDVNYEKLINDMKYRINLNNFRSLSLLEKVWYVNTFILSKLWYLAKIYPPTNKHLAKIKSLVGMFLWKNNVFRVDRRQLYLDTDQGGLGLIDPESKCKALFIQNIINQNNVTGNRNDEQYLLNFKFLQRLTRNGKEWIEQAKIMQATHAMDSTYQIYRVFLGQQMYTPRVEEVYPDVNWQILWKNISSSFLSTPDRSKLYLLLNDLIANKQKMFQYGIGRIENDLCDVCNEPDSNFHRLRTCHAGQEVRHWVKRVLTKRFSLSFDNIEDVVNWEIDVNSPLQKAVMWLVVHYISYMISSYPRSNLFVFQRSIREFRWNNMLIVKKHFHGHLNIC